MQACERHADGQSYEEKMGKQNITHREILSAVKKREYAPVYLLMGDESYYIDVIADAIADSVLPQEQRDFNQTIIYCTRETSVSDIVNGARRYPMMAEHQVIIVKEAQNLSKLDELSVYAQNPLSTTILVICHKGGSVDRRKKLVSSVEKVGIVFESKKLKEGMLPQFITAYLQQRSLTIEQRAVQMLAESVGADLSRLVNELDKLALALLEGDKQIVADMVESVVGISKEFNLWELRTAIANKDVDKAYRINYYFNQNTKANSAVATVAMLFNFFAQVMLAYYAPERTEQGLMEQLDLRQNWQLREYTTAMRNYTAMQTMRIIGKLREADARLKGIERGNLTDADIMNELMFYILH